MSEQLGKIGHQLIDDFMITRCGIERPEVRIGPSFGVDVSVIDLRNGMSLVAASDPLSLIPSLGLEESAWLSVHLMANDIATTGFAPQYAQFVLNLPPSLSENDFRTYWDYIHQFSKAIGVSITGGHTGFVEGQNSTIAGGGTLFATAPTKKVLTSSSARLGDSILVTKSSAISSSAILAMSFPKTVQNKCGIETYHRAVESFYQTSVLSDALAAVGNEGHHTDISAMHDVTEGGVVGAIYELIQASKCGALLYKDKIPVGHEQLQVCTVFGLDPLYSIGAGSMIIICASSEVQKVIANLASQNIACCEVGIIKEQSFGIKIKDGDVVEDVLYVAQDPYWAAFFNAYKQGLQ